MNLKEIRAAITQAPYLPGSILRGGTFQYCAHHVNKLDKNGRRTGRSQPCGKKLRDESAMRRHIRKAHA